MIGKDEAWTAAGASGIQGRQRCWEALCQPWRHTIQTSLQGNLLWGGQLANSHQLLYFWVHTEDMLFPGCSQLILSMTGAPELGYSHSVQDPSEGQSLP